MPRRVVLRTLLLLLSSILGPSTLLSTTVVPLLPLLRVPSLLTVPTSVGSRRPRLRLLLLLESRVEVTRCRRVLSLLRLLESRRLLTLLRVLLVGLRVLRAGGLGVGVVLLLLRGIGIAVPDGWVVVEAGVLLLLLILLRLGRSRSLRRGRSHGRRPHAIRAILGVERRVGGSLRYRWERCWDGLRSIHGDETVAPSSLDLDSIDTREGGLLRQSHPRWSRRQRSDNPLPSTSPPSPCIVPSSSPTSSSPSPSILRTSTSPTTSPRPSPPRSAPLKLFRPPLCINVRIPLVDLEARRDRTRLILVRSSFSSCLRSLEHDFWSSDRGIEVAVVRERGVGSSREAGGGSTGALTGGGSRSRGC